MKLEISRLEHASSAPAPERGARAQSRRTQVVDAARECFRRNGFHGASMAEIATEAGMSVGQIYRFFSGKEAIIQAIVEEGVAQKIDHIASIERAALASGQDVALATANAKAEIAVVESREDAALLLEILAEAARNPRVAEIVELNDRLLRERAEQMVASARPQWPPERVREVVRIIAVLHEGWYLRVIADPTACSDGAARMRAELIAQVLAP